MQERLVIDMADTMREMALEAIARPLRSALGAEDEDEAVRLALELVKVSEMDSEDVMKYVQENYGRT